MKVSFCNLLKKNFIIEWRSRWKLLLEILVLVFCYTMVVIRPSKLIEQSFLLSSSKTITKVYTMETVDNLNVFMRLLYLKRRPIRLKLAFAPDIPYVRTIVENVAKRLDLRGTIPFQSTDQLMARIDMKTTLAGISLPVSEDPNSLPNTFDVQIHFPAALRTVKPDNVAERMWLTRCLGVPTENELDVEDFSERDIYIREAFLHLQNLVFLEWFGMLKEKFNITMPTPDIRARAYRNGEPNWTNCSVTGDSNLFGHLCYLSFLLPFLNLLSKYGRDRELNLLAHHWRYGCENRKYWFAHFIVSYMHFLLLDMVVMFIVMVPWTRDPYSGILFHGSYRVPAFFLLHSLGLILFAIALVSILRNAKTAILMGLTLWLTFYIMIAVTVENIPQDLDQPYVLAAFVLFFNNSLPFAYDYFRDFELLKLKSEIWILFTTQVVHIVLVLIVIIIALHFAPGRYMKRSNFDLLGMCWYCRRRQLEDRLIKRNKRPLITLMQPTPSATNFERGPETGVDNLNLRNVCTAEQGLNNISMRFLKGEITVILGHCGSGKTTLISIMAGWHEPAYGWVYRGNTDIYANWPMVRQSIDVLMPNNILFDLLTAQEMLWYYVRIKMTKSNDITKTKEVNKWLKLLKPLIDYKHENMVVKRLTFGQQRLLSLCCVMAGDTPVVLLDEPTLHLSPAEMRFFWDLLQEEKTHRAIVLTTISIDEAETIGDRIGILSNGVLQAFGTSFFLKVKYGNGFKLILLKKPEAIVQPITSIVQKYIPDIVPHNDFGDQVIYILSDDKRPIFQRLLIELERDRERLGIVELRMLGSELTEAYMNIDISSQSSSIKQSRPSVQIPQRIKEQRSSQQFQAIFYKKVLEQMPCVLPLIVLIFTIVISLFINGLSPNISHDRKHNGFMLGLPNSTRKMDMLPQSLAACNIVGIDFLAHNKLTERQNTLSNLLLTNKSLICLNNVNKLPPYGLVEFKDEQAIFWFNQHVFHSAPIALNILQNLLLIRTFPNASNYLTTLDNYALKLPLWVRINLFDQVLANLRAPMLFGFVVPLMTATFINTLAQERRNHMLFMQVMAGMQMKIYWIVNFLCDWLIFIVYSVILLLLLNITHIKIFEVRAQLLCFWLLVVYGMAGIALVYLISMCRFRRPLHAFLTAYMVQQLIGLCAFNFYWDVIENNTAFYHIALFLPTFALLDAISNIYCVEYQRKVCEKFCSENKDCNIDRICETLPGCCDDNNLRYKDPGILAQMSYMFFSFVVLIFIIFFVDLLRKELKHRLPKGYKRYRSAAFPYDDDDVVKLKRRLAEADMRVCRRKRCYVDQLELYRPKREVVLHTVSFEVDTGESMCIFGGRHSGKTQLIRELVGERGFVHGDVFIMGRELKFDCLEAQTRLGYCPQGNEIAIQLTPFQILRVFCLLRGIPNDQIDEAIQEIALALNLLRHLDHKTAKMSEANRRKLAVAIALIADNDVIVLDEPTRGMPAITRREIWNVLRLARTCGKALIFSTSTGLECEALADRVVVFDQGEMWAIGSAHYLRHKFTQGFYLEIQLKRDGLNEDAAEENFHKDLENLDRFVTFLHADSELRSHVETLLRFFLPVDGVIYSFVFGSLEKNYRRLNIETYTVSLGTMEDVLRNVALKRLHRFQITS